MKNTGALIGDLDGQMHLFAKFLLFCGGEGESPPSGELGVRMELYGMIPCLMRGKVGKGFLQEGICVTPVTHQPFASMLDPMITPMTHQPHCRRDKNSVSSPPIEPCFDVPNNSLNHFFNSLFLWLEKLTKKSSNQTTYLFSCQTSL